MIQRDEPERNGREGETSTKPVDIRIQGICSPDTRKGHWIAVLYADGGVVTLNGEEEDTTAPRMYIRAAIEGLRALAGPRKVRIRCNLKYLVDEINEDWIYKRAARGWKDRRGKPVKNDDLLRELLELSVVHELRLVKV